MPVESSPFGQTRDGKPVTKFTLANNQSVSVEIINYGGTIIAVNMPDKKGTTANICLGFDSIEGYQGDNPYFGALIGRFANRIAKGKFSLNGTEYQLATNDGQNHLHGGNIGFDKVVWDAEPFENENECGVILRYTSPDGEEGYPGNLTVQMTYSLTDTNELKMIYEAQTDKDTPINLTNHAYWNLAGAGSGQILEHELQLEPCTHYLPSSEALIPTGEMRDVAGTPFDFTSLKKIGRDFDKVPGGYDHCYVIKRCCDCLKEIAFVREPNSGRTMKIFTTKPGVQLYTGNFISNIHGANGKVFNQQDGFCLETQFYPDSINQPELSPFVLKPGSTYKHVTVHQFAIED